MRKTEKAKAPEDYREISPEWDRIEKLTLHFGFRTVARFAREVGTTPTVMFHLRKGHNITYNLADKITRRFPEISKGWLMTGEGTMLKADIAVVKSVPAGGEATFCITVKVSGER